MGRSIRSLGISTDTGESRIKLPPSRTILIKNHKPRSIDLILLAELGVVSLPFCCASPHSFTTKPVVAEPRGVGSDWRWVLAQYPLLQQIPHSCVNVHSPGVHTAIAAVIASVLHCHVLLRKSVFVIPPSQLRGKKTYILALLQPFNNTQTVSTSLELAAGQNGCRGGAAHGRGTLPWQYAPGNFNL